MVSQSTQVENSWSNLHTSRRKFFTRLRTVSLLHKNLWGRTQRRTQKKWAWQSRSHVTLAYHARMSRSHVTLARLLVKRDCSQSSFSPIAVATQPKSEWRLYARWTCSYLRLLASPFGQILRYITNTKIEKISPEKTTLNLEWNNLLERSAAHTRLVGEFTFVCFKLANN